MKVTFKRNCKVWGCDLSYIKSDIDRTNKTTRRISKHIRELINSGQIINISRNGYVKYSNGEELTKAQFKNKINHLFDEDAVNESLKREVVIYILERYAGYFGRNGAKRGLKINSPITIKGKSFYLKDAFVTIDKENKALYFQTMYTGRGEKRKVPFKFSLNLDRLVRKKFGGNLVIRQNCFIVAVDVDFTPLYKAEDVLAFDMNQSEKDWLYLSNGIVIEAPKNIKSLCDEIKVINKKLDKDKKKKVADRKYRSPERRKIRLLWKKKHKELKTLIHKVAEELVDFAENSRFLLAIDGVKAGQQSGTFGQDHLIPALQTMCENRGVPFYVVNPSYTSQACSHCGHVSKTARKTTDEYICENPDCEHHNIIQDAQNNGAQNVKQKAEKMIVLKVPNGNWSKNRLEFLKKKFASQ